MELAVVTGGCGLIGQHICSGLLKKGYAVIAIDREAGVYNEGKLNYSFVKASPTDRDEIADVFEKNDVSIFIHAACTVDNDLEPVITTKEIEESRKCDKFIFRYAIDNHVKKIILISTDQVYEYIKSREPVREDHDLKPMTNYAQMKIQSEKALISELKHHDDVLCCITRSAPVYTLNFTENLVAKITDVKSKRNFIIGKGQYGFQFCCVHNLVDFMLCFVKNADNATYSGTYNIGDKLLITASEIVAFMREHHHLGVVVQKNNGFSISKIKDTMFSSAKDEKTNYRYLDMKKIDNNNMLDITKAAKLCSPRWDIHNTK